MKWRAYLRLMRFHKPVGILLLWLPTAWALWLAYCGNPPLKIVILFFMGTVATRAAGCVINDIADRHIDLHVERTKTRPLTSGELSLTDALLCVGCLLVIALLVLLQLPTICFYYALLALLQMIIYPLCKRWIQAPQCVLGMAFSMGIPMAYAASGTGLNASMGLLLWINFCWIVSYDSQYAMADRVDDLRIGVKSTAILFAQHDRLIIGLLQILFHGSWLLLLPMLLDSWIFWLYWGIAGLILCYQQKLIATRQPKDCLQAFVSNAWYGSVMWLAIVV